MFRIIGLLLIVVFLGGCGSRYPSSINKVPNSEATVSDVQQGLSESKGVTIRWGGVIANINNHQKETWLEIVQLSLKSNGKPHETDVTLGRFIVKVDGFLDPAIYAKGREFTVVGILSGLNEGKIGEFEYKFPVVAAQGYYLWPETHETGYYNSYLIPVTYWRPYLPFYYPIHYRPVYRPHQVPSTSRPQTRAPRVAPSRTVRPTTPTRSSTKRNQQSH